MSVVVEKAFTGTVPVGNGTVNIVTGVSTDRFNAVDFILNATIPPGIVGGVRYMKLNVSLTQVVPMTPDDRIDVDTAQATAQQLALAGAPKIRQTFANFAALPSPTAETEGSMVALTDSGSGSPGLAVLIAGVWIVFNSP